MAADSPVVPASNSGATLDDVKEELQQIKLLLNSEAYDRKVGYDVNVLNGAVLNSSNTVLKLNEKMYTNIVFLLSGTTTGNVPIYIVPSMSSTNAQIALNVNSSNPHGYQILGTRIAQVSIGTANLGSSNIYVVFQEFEHPVKFYLNIIP